MRKQKLSTELNPEIAAVNAVYEALKRLDPEVQGRVLSYVSRMLKINVLVEAESQRDREHTEIRDEKIAEDTTERPMSNDAGPAEGVSPVAQKWMARNGIVASAISEIFSVGGDEIDLIAKDIPGKSKRERMHAVLLLKGIASYLGSGAARFTHAQLKEACLHYKAYDTPNFAKYLKDFGADVAGDKSTSYALTARGLSNATDMLKSMIQTKN
ncbi:MAG TPA: hypothetical protein VMU53_17990 [Candidatus Sulfotelmatobacter sp.]|nr:hypothetical protein [Candidatus Sulfotelmatobacter sp.]